MRCELQLLARKKKQEKEGPPNSVKGGKFNDEHWGR